MAFDPAIGTDLAWVQLRTGQTGSSPEIVEATITALLASADNKWYAAAEVLESLLAKWQAAGKGKLREKVDDLDISRGSGLSAFEALRAEIDKLKEEGARQLAGTTRPAFFQVLGGPNSP